jgi:hypothetical protein
MSNDGPKILAVRLVHTVLVGSQSIPQDNIVNKGLEGDTMVGGRRVDMSWDRDSRFVRIVTYSKDGAYPQLIPVSNIALVTVSE